MNAMRDLLAAVQSRVRAHRDHPRLPGLRYPLWVATVVVLTVVAEAFLLAFGPRAIGWSTFIVYGGSMEPAISIGSMAVARPVSPQALQVGDVIAYRFSGSVGTPTLHRVVEVRDGPVGPSFVIKGDANRDADPFIVTLHGRGSKVMYSVPMIGRVAAFSRGRAGGVLLVEIPLVLVGIVSIFEIWRPGQTRRLLKWP